VTPEQITRALLTGTIDAIRFPELRSGALRDEVVQRLSSIAMELIHSKSRNVFFAHPSARSAGEDGDGYKPYHHLHDDARWLLSILWMFLVYLPDLVRERSKPASREASIRLQDLKIFVREAGMKIATLNFALAQLKRAGFVEGAEMLREGYRMSALANWEMTAGWDRCVQEFRRREWFKDKYESYLAELAHADESNATSEKDEAEAPNATD
jgi:hypothetical protein